MPFVVLDRRRDSILTGLNVILFIVIVITRDKQLGWEHPAFTFAPSPHARERGHRVVQKGIIPQNWFCNARPFLGLVLPGSVWNAIQTCKEVVVLWVATTHNPGSKDLKTPFFLEGFVPTISYCGRRTDSVNEPFPWLSQNPYFSLPSQAMGYNSMVAVALGYTNRSISAQHAIAMDR
jgi:hypothetical protein